MLSHVNNFISYFKGVYEGAREIKTIRLSSLRKVFSCIGHREKIVFWVLVFLAAASLTWSTVNFYYAHTVVAPTYGGVYLEGMVGQPTYINPLLAHQDTDIALTKLVYSGLYKYDAKGQIAPDLAESMPEISDDQKQYTITLRKNVKWHNDKPFTADDVVYTIQTLQDPAYKSPYRTLWQSTNVEKLSDLQVRFTTKDISAPFIHNLTLPILPKGVWGGIEPQNFVLSTYNLQAVGTGPYVVREIKKLSSGKIEQITLESFSNFYEGKPKVDTVTIKFFDTNNDLINAFHSKEIGSFGYIALDSSLYVDQSRQDVQVLRLPLPHYQVLFYNTRKTPLNDAQVRKALTLGIDRDGIVKDVFQNNAIVPEFYPFAPEAVATLLSYDTEQAKQILDTDGWTVDAKTGLREKKNVPLELTIATNDFLLNSKAAENIADQWKTLGVKVNLTVLPTKQLTDEHIRNRNFDVLLFPQKLDADPDPFAFWHSSQVKDPGLNLTGFSSAEADKLITEARSTTNPDIRKQKYEAFTKLIDDQAPAVFLNQTLYIYALDSKIKNVNLNTIYDPSHIYYDIRSWHMEEGRVWK